MNTLKERFEPYCGLNHKKCNDRSCKDCGYLIKKVFIINKKECKNDIRSTSIY